MRTDWKKRLPVLLMRAVPFLFPAAVVFGTVFGLATAYSLPIRAGLLALICAGETVFFTALAELPQPPQQPQSGWGDRFRRIAPAAVLLAAAVCFRKPILASIRVTAETLTDALADAYAGLDLLRLPHEELTAENADSTWLLSLTGGYLAWAASRIGADSPAVMNRRMRALLIPYLPAVLLQLLIADCSPDPWAFALTVFACLWLILTCQIRRQKARRTAALLLIPAAFLASAALVFPAKTYQAPAWREKTLNAITEFFEKDEEQPSNVLPQQMETLGTRMWNETLDCSPLAEVGPEERTGIHVMDVFADESVRCYLFGTAYGMYENNCWLPVTERTYGRLKIEESHWLADGYGTNTILIRTDRSPSVFYLPYGTVLLPPWAEIERDRCVHNPEGLREYLLAVSDSPTGFGKNAGYRSFARNNYTVVPEETKERLSGITAELKEATEGMSVSETAEAVAEYVKASAGYDLQTPRMPEGEDFVSWFLLESETGYCVHFATAAAILLRCLGIPSRYVTGYAAYLPGGKWVEVTEDAAHAWAEYYLDGQGWVVLEATAAQSLTPAQEEEETEEAFYVPEYRFDGEAESPGTVEASIVEENLPAEPEEPLPEDPDAGTGTSGSAWLLIPGIAGLFLLWQAAVRGIRFLRLSRGERNRRAARLYYHAEKLAQLTDPDAEAPETVRQLAEKARFSRSGVTDEELEVMTREVGELRERLFAGKNVWGRLWLRLRYVL